MLLLFVNFLVYIMYVVNIQLIIYTLVDDGKFNKWSWILSVVYAVAAIVNKVLDLEHTPGLICAIAPFILLYIIMLSAHKKEPMKSLYFIILYISLDGLITTMATMMFSLIMPSVYVPLASKTIYLIFNLIFFFLFRKLMDGRAEEARTSMNLIPSKLGVLILIYTFILSFLCLYLQVAYTKRIELLKTLHVLRAVAVTITVISFIIILFLLMNSISRFYYQETSLLLDKQLQLQLKYYEKIEQMATDTRKFRHDYNNHMTCLHSLLIEDKSEEAMEYLESIANHPTMKLSSFKSGNPIADAILNDKAMIAKSENCRLNFSGIISDRISAFDICTILSNALDNSLEACRKIDTEKEKDIKVNCALKNEMQIICISNPSLKTDPLLKTTKENKENHGFGLYNIKRTVETLNGTMNISQTSPEFILDVMFRLPEKKSHNT